VAALSLATLFCGATLSLCAGWHPSRSVRMACCTTSGQKCSQVIADSCCAAGEQQRHAETVLQLAPVPVLMPLPIQSAMAQLPIAAASWLPVVTSDPGSPPATHLLLSVFLI
jgi:hypothetical protein